MASGLADEAKETPEYLSDEVSAHACDYGQNIFVRRAKVYPNGKESVFHDGMCSSSRLSVIKFNPRVSPELRDRMSTPNGPRDVVDSLTGRHVRGAARRQDFEAEDWSSAGLSH